MITNWEISREDNDLLIQVAERALRELTNYPDDKRTLIMDLNACHSNACPLYFQGLLAAPMQDFSHDIYGIRQHINRETGALEGFFSPRYALSNHVTTPVAAPKPPEPVWISIDGEEYTLDEAELFLEENLIERCTDDECPHHYHALPGFTDADLLVTLEREGMGPRRSRQ